MGIRHAKAPNPLRKASKFLEACIQGIKLKPNAKSLVLFFVGPPRVGKISLASFTYANLGSKFIRISLDGPKDEAGIIGHMRTHIRRCWAALLMD
ncbi:lon protease homolog 2, peroxisomal-like protein isoform X2 [Tanacetum coccineum]